MEREWGHYSYSLQAFEMWTAKSFIRKPTYTLAAADPKQRHFTAAFLDCEKKLLNEEIDHLLFGDESMIRDYQAIQKTWFLRGKQRIIPTTGKHRGVKLLATVDYETGHIVLARR
ncbi:hypothetical protein P7H20_23960 [Paenibacillus larvae]|nr:hypothetical protein [Paenibacillus larvae]MDT2277288.1 hypothetical protein [Paenibacillus larvae]